MFIPKRKPVNRKVAKRAPMYWKSRSLLDWLSLSAKIFAGVLVFIGFYQLFFVSSAFKLKEVKISGEFRSMSEENLLHLARVPYGKNLFWVNLYGVAKRIKENPWIRDVQVRRKFPNGILIRVEEYQAVAILEASRPKMEPNYYLVSSEGVIFKKTRAQNAGRLPVLAGFEEAKLRKYPTYFASRTAESFKILEKFREDPANAEFTVQKIYSHLTEGIKIQIARNGTEHAAQLYLGQGDTDRKLADWARFAPVMTGTEGQPLAYRYVDLHVVGKIFARL